MGRDGLDSYNLRNGLRRFAPTAVTHIAASAKTFSFQFGSVRPDRG
jgi:hypothetical protein